MRAVSKPAILLFLLIVAGLAWALWPSPLQQGQLALRKGDAAQAVEKLRPLAEGGNAEAQFAMGQLSARPGADSPSTAVEWFLKAAAQSHAGAAVELGDRSARGDGVQASTDDALRWYRRAAAQGNAAGLQRLTDLAQQGNAAAQLHLGQLFAKGEGVPVAKGEAARWFYEAAKRAMPEARQSLMALAAANVADANYYAGLLYDRGEAVAPDRAKAATAYAKAGEQSHVLAQVRLAELHEGGLGVPRNESAAAEWYGKASRQGNPLAQYRLGERLHRGRGVPRNEAEAARLLAAAATQGVREAIPPLQALATAGQADAQFALSTSYQRGGALPQDAAQGFAWLRKAAESGLPLAQLDLAFAYSQGQGTAVDLGAAAEWYQRAWARGLQSALPKLAQLATGGEPVAQLYYGRYLLNGGTVQMRPADMTDDLVNAVKRWFKRHQFDPVTVGLDLLRKSADAGNVEAQYELGNVYLAGKHVAASRDEAAAWFRKAAEAGHARAREALATLPKP